MDFSPWVLFTDIGLISLLLLAGTIIRAKVGFVQRMFLPASIIGGLLALLLGPNGFGLLPFSDQMGTSEIKTLYDYSLAYIPIAPVEIMLVTFAPLLVLNSQGLLFVGITFAFSFVIYLMAIKYKWLNKKA
jgi:Na+/glutamate symporter